jgi:hypothetical protein
MTSAPDDSERRLPEDLGARETGRPMSAAPSLEGNDRAEGPRPDLSARDLQANSGQDELETTPGSDADQANEVPHVG